MTSSQRPNYAKIPLQKRQMLIQMVFQEHMSIAKAGRKLLIKPSTAKLIVRKYRQTGGFFIKKAKKPEQEETVSPNQFYRPPFVNPLFYALPPANPLAENNFLCNYNMGVNQFQNGGCYVWPMDLTNFVVYY